MAIDPRELRAREILSGPIGERTEWCVITGAPGAGKTTVLREIARRGYETSPDISRRHLEGLLSAIGEKYEIRADGDVLQRDILWQMLLLEGALKKETRIFLDYALPDNLAFWELANIAFTSEVWRASVRFRYRDVFLLERLPLTQDPIRTESVEDQQKITESLFQIYSAIGYDVKRVPVGPVGERADTILRTLARDVRDS